MAQVKGEKKGGPYTQNEREQRQNEVHKLHFEYGHTAVEIAGMLNVNRNTVNEDIKFLYSKLSLEWKGFDTGSWILKQIQRLESQRSRYREELDNAINFQDKIEIEKQISEVEKKMVQIILKMPIKEKIEQDEVSEELVVDVVKHLKKYKGSNASKCKHHEMIVEIIKYQKCEVGKASAIIQKMKNMGLNLFYDSGFPNPDTASYDLEKFSEMRDIK